MKKIENEEKNNDDIAIKYKKPFVEKLSGTCFET